ncbi:hypothetical protein ACWF62_01000 [Rhodococcus sp. NPDC054953]
MDGELTLDEATVRAAAAVFADSAAELARLAERVETALACGDGRQAGVTRAWAQRTAAAAALLTSTADRYAAQEVAAAAAFRRLDW